MSNIVSGQEYFKTRAEAYQQDTAKRVKSSIATRRLQVLPGQRGYTIGLPMSIVRLLNLREQDLMKFRLQDNNDIVLSKVNLDNE